MTDEYEARIADLEQELEETRANIKKIHVHVEKLLAGKVHPDDLDAFISDMEYDLRSLLIGR